MELTLKDALRKGIYAHNQCNVTESLGLFLSILQVQPDHPESNHSIGSLVVSLNKAALPLPIFKTALKENPKKVQYWLSYIKVLIKENDLETAKAVLEQGVRHYWVLLRLKH